MFSKGGVAAEDLSRGKKHSISSCRTHSRASSSCVCNLSGFGILVLLGACTSGCTALGLASAPASVARRAEENPGAKPQSANTPSATSHPSEDGLTTIRQELAAGEYTKAHHDLAVVAQHYDQLTPVERRDVRDNLCLTEYLIGQGSYPLPEQQRVCLQALAEPSSVSGAILVRIHDSLKQSVAEEVRRELGAQDLAGAEAAALAYRASPGADPELLAEWSKDFWQVVHGQERPAERKQRVTSLIGNLTNVYPQAKMMSEPDFSHWVVGAAAVSNKPIISALTVKGDTLDLLVLERDLPTVATNLYKFVRINDVFAARCACDARTNVGVADLGFPAYLFRLDPEERTSKVLIAIGEPDAGATSPLASGPGESVGSPVEAKASGAPMVGTAFEPSQKASTESKPSRTGPPRINPTEGTSPASLPNQSSSGEQSKSKPKQSGSRSNSQSSRTQPTHRSVSKVESQASDIPVQSHNEAVHGNWVAIGYKSRHELTVYFKGRRLKRYVAVFGSNFRAGPKLWEGDRRTPEGTYTIVAKHPSHHWKYFLLLNYPNRQDRIYYQRLQRTGAAATASRPEGGSIGIHGTDRPLLNQQKFDWTAGCISVDNRAIAELYRLLPVGAVVTVRP